MKPDVELQIEELVLDGFPPIDRQRITVAVERELGRLLAERDLPAALQSASSTSYLDGGSFQAAAGAGAEAVGEQVGRAVYGGLAR